MKRILLFLFNLARNISLLIVLAFAAMLGYSYYTGELQQAWAEYKSQEAIIQAGTSPDVMLQYEESWAEAVEADQMNKVRLSASKSTHFIRPEQIAFFGFYDGKAYAVTARGDTVQNIRSSLSKILEALSDYEGPAFFQTRDALINYHFVSQYYTVNHSARGSDYRSYVVMETRDTLVIPHHRYQEFLQGMEQYALPIE